MTERTHPVALVTGTASGMGKAVATHFMHSGWQVIGVDLTVQESSEYFTAVQADITDQEALNAAIADALAGRKLSAVINAAGIFPYPVSKAIPVLFIAAFSISMCLAP